MGERRDARLVREMGYSVDEFARVLPAAMRDWTVSGGPLQWRVDAADGPVAAIALTCLPARRIGALAIPVCRVEIDLDVASAATADEFLRRFERGFHRGGG